MTVRRVHAGAIELAGACDLEDAEPLLRLLIETPDARVDWGACETLHTAVLQVLMAARATMAGQPRQEFLAQRVAPLLTRGSR